MKTLPNRLRAKAAMAELSALIDYASETELWLSRAADEIEEVTSRITELQRIKATAAAPFASLFQDSEGKIPVTEEGQRAGRMECESGMVLVQINPALRPVVRLVDGQAHVYPLDDEYMISEEKPE